MLVSAKDMLVKAKEGHYAVGQFNINNLEWTKSILLTAQDIGRNISSYSPGKCRQLAVIVSRVNRLL